jgi:hypothetical protein
VPLVVMLHGCGQDAKRFATSTRMSRIAVPAHSEHAAPLRTAVESRPSLLVIHGGAYRVVSVGNGHAAVLHWAQAAGAVGGTSRIVQRGKRHAMTVTDFRKGSVVAARQSYSDAKGPDVSRMAWAFMAAQLRA